MFIRKNIDNFVSSKWELHNRCYHNLQNEKLTTNMTLTRFVKKTAFIFSPQVSVWTIIDGQLIAKSSVTTITEPEQRQDPSLNTQSFIKGLLGGTRFLFLGRLGSQKKKFGADYEQLLRAVFSCFWGQNFKFFLILKTL